MKRKREREHSRNIKVNRKADFEGYFSIYLKKKKKKKTAFIGLHNEGAISLLALNCFWSSRNF